MVAMGYAQELWTVEKRRRSLNKVSVIVLF